MPRVNRFSPSRSIRTLLRALLPLFVLAAMLPAVASAQDPGVGGYAGNAPNTVEDTEPPPESAVQEEEVASPPAPAEPVAAPQTNALPFTGFQIAAMIAAGFALLGLGMALRRVSRPAMPGT